MFNHSCYTDDEASAAKAKYLNGLLSSRIISFCISLVLVDFLIVMLYFTLPDAEPASFTFKLLFWLAIEFMVSLPIFMCVDSGLLNVFLPDDPHLEELDAFSLTRLASVSAESMDVRLSIQRWLSEKKTLRHRDLIAATRYAAFIADFRTRTVAMDRLSD